MTFVGAGGASDQPVPRVYKKPGAARRHQQQQRQQQPQEEPGAGAEAGQSGGAVHGSGEQGPSGGCTWASSSMPLVAGVADSHQQQQALQALAGRASAKDGAAAARQANRESARQASVTARYEQVTPAVKRGLQYLGFRIFLMTITSQRWCPAQRGRTPLGHHHPAHDVWLAGEREGE